MIKVLHYSFVWMEERELAGLDTHIAPNCGGLQGVISCLICLISCSLLHCWVLKVGAWKILLKTFFSYRDIKRRQLWHPDPCIRSLCSVAMWGQESRYRLSADQIIIITVVWSTNTLKGHETAWQSHASLVVVPANELWYNSLPCGAAELHYDDCSVMSAVEDCSHSLTMREWEQTGRSCHPQLWPASRQGAGGAPVNIYIAQGGHNSPFYSLQIYKVHSWSNTKPTTNCRIYFWTNTYNFAPL